MQSAPIFNVLDDVVVVNMHLTLNRIHAMIALSPHAVRGPLFGGVGPYLCVDGNMDASSLDIEVVGLLPRTQTMLRCIATPHPTQIQSSCMMHGVVVSSGATLSSAACVRTRSASIIISFGNFFWGMTLCAPSLSRFCTAGDT